MSEVVRIIRGEVITLKKDSSKVFDEFQIEKDGKQSGSRFVFKVQTRVNDRVDNSPRLFKRCSFFAKTAEDASNIKASLNLGTILDIDGVTNRRSFNDKDGNKVWIDEVDVKGITVIQPAAGTQQTPAASSGNDDLPF